MFDYCKSHFLLSHLVSWLIQLLKCGPDLGDCVPERSMCDRIDNWKLGEIAPSREG